MEKQRAPVRAPSVLTKDVYRFFAAPERSYEGLSAFADTAAGSASVTIIIRLIAIASNYFLFFICAVSFEIIDYDSLFLFAHSASRLPFGSMRFIVITSPFLSGKILFSCFLFTIIPA